MRKNLFIVFEGIDGSGKSTQLKFLKENLENAGHKVYSTFEPTDSPIGKMIRDIFTRKMEADEKVIAGLFVADRLHHITNKENGLLKILDEGYTVICDRFYLSSYVYQGVNVPLDWVIQANSLSAELLKPDMNIFIDISPETSMQRLSKGRDSLEIYETLENMQKVRAKYMKVFDMVKSSENILTIDGERTPEEISEDIWREVSERIRN